MEIDGILSAAFLTHVLTVTFSSFVNLHELLLPCGYKYYFIFFFAADGPVAPRESRKYFPISAADPQGRAQELFVLSALTPLH